MLNSDRLRCIEERQPVNKRIGNWREKFLLAAALAVLAAPAALALAQEAEAKQVPAKVDESTPQTTPKMTFLELLVKGGPLMIPIAACSLLGLAVVIERLIALRRGAVIPPGFLEGLKAAFHHDSQDRAAGLSYCASRDCPLGRITRVGIMKLPRGEEAVEQAIEDAGANEISLLRRNLRMLFGVAAVAPMLGLLGTVWGMIEAFQIASDPNIDVTNRGPLLGKGIYEALVTTFAGLTVAIPALIAYYYFQGRIDRLVHDMNASSVEFVEHYLGQGGQEARP